jgi:CheY-like chemotaxis protein
MSPDMMARLFRPFEQGDVGIGRRFGGTGLGLVISKQIVADMRGDIHVESSLGQGSRFSFKLKLQETTAPLTITAPRTRKSESCCSSLAILIVDDVPVNRTVARVMLERLGYEADFANDGQEAIDAATKKDYDVIFMDLQMPGMSGIEATKNIIEKLSGKPMPQVIAMSASVFEEDRAACRAAGMRDFIAKPIDLAKLAMTLERVTEECERSMPTPLKTTSLDPAPLEQLRQLEALDHPGFVANLCQEFLADTPVRIQRMTETLSSGEFNVLEREAHSLKSSSASLGAMELSKLCGTIETSARTKTVDGVEQLLEQLTQELSRVEAELRREGLA